MLFRSDDNDDDDWSVECRRRIETGEKRMGREEDTGPAVLIMRQGSLDVTRVPGHPAPVH